MINRIQLICCIILLFFIFGCASVSTSEKEECTPYINKFLGNPNTKKNIFVFLDGTDNKPQSGTNIWRLFELIKNDNNPQTTAMYIPGVGCDTPATGKLLGKGMEERILKGYSFIIQNYKPDDSIYIFGFSRGAHQARALAGFIAYAGVPTVFDKDKDVLKRVGNKILELTKKKRDSDYYEKWKLWNPAQKPLLASEIKEKLNVEMQAAEIAFLGIWDIVPGSSLKDYGYCKEKIGCVKKYFFWLPGIDRGERYKSDSYPAIRQIAHAVSIDEKRSKFKPLLLCNPINPEYTKIAEVWFPGAHADVGGGYEDSDGGLSGISLNWIIDLLSESYKFKKIPKVEENAGGLAHHSIDLVPFDELWKCEDRILPSDAIIHQSFEERKKLSPVPIITNEGRQELNYPMEKCTE